MLGGAPRAHGDGHGEEIIARDGSSSPTLCTSRTGAGGAPCSGRTRPGHRASPGGAGGGESTANTEPTVSPIDKHTETLKDQPSRGLYTLTMSLSC